MGINKSPCRVAFLERHQNGRNYKLKYRRYKNESNANYEGNHYRSITTHYDDNILPSPFPHGFKPQIVKIRVQKYFPCNGYIHIPRVGKMVFASIKYLIKRGKAMGTIILIVGIITYSAGIYVGRHWEYFTEE